MCMCVCGREGGGAGGLVVCFMLLDTEAGKHEPEFFVQLLVPSDQPGLKQQVKFDSEERFCLRDEH